MSPDELSTDGLSVEDLTMPFDHPNMLEVPPIYHRLRGGTCPVRVITPANDPAWFVTSYEDVRALFADNRINRFHHDPDSAPRCWQAGLLGKPLVEPMVRQMREMKARTQQGYLSPQKVRELAPRVQSIADHLVRDMAAAGPPADLHTAFATPLAVLAICEILGVPGADRSEFCAWSEEAELLTEGDRARGAATKLGMYVFELMQRKLAEPGDDLITDLAKSCQSGEYDHETAIMWALGLLFAGHRSSTARIELGTMFLLAHPEAQAALHDGPDAVTQVVEEVLRLAAPGALSVALRWATESIDVSGVSMERGDLILLGFAAANTDPSVFDEPDRFDHTRSPNPHIAFGLGSHYCLGSSLARLELQVAFQTLFSALPGLRLARPFEEFRLREEMTGGLNEFPVTW
jgi:pentalenolactone synthase